MVDYLIVGAGLAGIGLAHTLRSKGRSFVVIDDGSQKSSSVAGGMYKPSYFEEVYAGVAS